MPLPRFHHHSSFDFDLMSINEQPPTHKHQLNNIFISDELQILCRYADSACPKHGQRQDIVFGYFSKTQIKLTKKEITKKSKKEHGSLEGAPRLYKDR